MKAMIQVDEKLIERKFKEIEQAILVPSPSNFPSTSHEWRDIVFQWQAFPLKRGGNLKRKGVYGKIVYSYRDQELTRSEAILEVCKPPELRQALIEAETAIECSVCGAVVVGAKALEPYRSITFYGGEMVKRKPWGLMFYRMNDDRLNESECLSVCPDCMDKIAKGEFRRK